MKSFFSKWSWLTDDKIFSELKKMLEHLKSKPVESEKPIPLPVIEVPPAAPRDIPNWDEFYLGLAFQYAGRSKDPATQHGAVVVDPNNIPLGFGYNGAPRQFKDNEIDWSRPNKYPFMKHAEQNAIDHCNRYLGVSGLDDCTIYVTGHPCSKCMLQIVSKGIKRICYGPLSYASGTEEDIKIAKFTAEKGNVNLYCFDKNLNWLAERTKFIQGLGLIK